MKRELIVKSLIGVITYIVSMIETIYVWLQLFNGSGYYYDLGKLIMKSLDLANIGVSNLGQSIILGPMVMSGYLPIFIAFLIIIANSLIAIYTYRLGKVRRLSVGSITTVVIASVTNASLIDLITNPWLPQMISTALAITMYYYIDRDDRLISTILSALLAFLSPTTDLLNVLTPITHWFVKREFNESSQYIVTIGLIAFTYYWIAGAYPLVHAVTAHEVLNNMIYLFSTTSFMQLATLGTAIPALITTVLGGIGFMAVVPAILIITLIETLHKLRENKMAVLTLAIALIITVLTTPISPMWPPYQGIRQVGINWEPLSRDYTDIYSLTSLAPGGYIESTVLPAYTLMAIDPGRQVVGYITPINQVNGTYAVCGDYQLVIIGYIGPLVVNDYKIVANQLIINATNYTEIHSSLKIPSGLYQSNISISTSELTIPPGTYVVTTAINVSRISQFMSTQLTNIVLPVSVGSVVYFNLGLNFTGKIHNVIIYGVSYTDQPATLSLIILRNGRTIADSTAEAPPITQGMKPYPISFNLNTNVEPGIYEVDIYTNQSLILYVTEGSGMKIINDNTTFNYPSNAPTYTVIYTTNESTPTRLTWFLVSMSIANQTVTTNITSGGLYVLRDVITVNNWINSSISLLIKTNAMVIPTNMTINSISIKPLEPAHCPTPAIIKALEEPGEPLLMSLAALPIAAALPLTPRPRLRPRLRRALLILGLALMLLFYVVWALGLTNIVPRLYEPEVLRVFGILFIIGLIAAIASAVM